MIIKLNIYQGIVTACIWFMMAGCAPSIVQKKENRIVPRSYHQGIDTLNTAAIKWKDFFKDPNLIALIDTALESNQELNIFLQEIDVAKNEIRARKGEYLPFVNLGSGPSVEKVGRYTSRGSSEATTDIEPGRETPDPLQDYYLGAFASWEIDIWNKLHNAKKAAMLRYLSSKEGKNFMVTQLIAEIANSYYELLALDNQLQIVRQNIAIQTNALEIVRMQKEATRVTELAVKRFEAHVLNTKGLQYDIQQGILETENRINFLVGRYPQPISRSQETFMELVPDTMLVGIPAQLLGNRPDIRQAELDLAAAKLDVKSAKANFYPSLGITAGIGVQAFDPTYLIKTPESILYSLAGDLAAPLVNRNAIKAIYYNANAKQAQAAYHFEQTVMKAYIEVANQVSNIQNLEQRFELKDKEVRVLTQSITISNNLFKSARADYLEVLLTQRDALESKFELVEIKKQQLNAMINIYQALGGGWE